MTMGENKLAVRPPGELTPGQSEQKEFSSAITITAQYIEQTGQSLTLLRQMVKEVLVEGRDYGSVPGVPEDFLWEPGADQIIAAFNCRPGPVRVINQVDDGEKISVVLEVPIMSLQTGQEVSCGVGAASTYETKHKYRWVRRDELPDWGYTAKEAVDSLKTKKDKWNNIKYRVPNPEHAELMNTIWKIARKRAKTGAAQSLPGVSSALREKFATKKDGKTGKQQEQQKPTSDWEIFWAEMRQMGLDQPKVHALLEVKSVKDWVKSGKSLLQAKAEIVRKLEQSPKEEGDKELLEEESENEPPEDFFPPEPGDNTSPPPETKLGRINEVWFNNTIDDLKWKPQTFATWVKAKFPGIDNTGAPRDIVLRMTPAQQEALEKLLQEMLEAKGV